MGQIFNKMVHCAAFQSDGIKQYPLCESLGIDVRVRMDSSVQLEYNGVMKSKITVERPLVVKVGNKKIASHTAFGRPAILSFAGNTLV